MEIPSREEIELSDFNKAIDALVNKEYREALQYFSRLDKLTACNNKYANLYSSYHGYLLVILGDVSGLNLCRRAALKEKSNSDVFYNQALAEITLKQRRNAFAAIRNGLVVKPANLKLNGLYKKLNLRVGSEFPFFSRANWFNKLVCKSALRFIPRF